MAFHQPAHPMSLHEAGFSPPSCQPATSSALAGPQIPKVRKRPIPESVQRAICAWHETVAEITEMLIDVPRYAWCSNARRALSNVLDPDRQLSGVGRTTSIATLLSYWETYVRAAKHRVRNENLFPIDTKLLSTIVEAVDCPIMTAHFFNSHRGPAVVHHTCNDFNMMLSEVADILSLAPSVYSSSFTDTSSSSDTSSPSIACANTSWYEHVYGVGAKAPRDDNLTAAELPADCSSEANSPPTQIESMTCPSSIPSENLNILKDLKALLSALRAYRGSGCEWTPAHSAARAALSHEIGALSGRKAAAQDLPEKPTIFNPSNPQVLEAIPADAAYLAVLESLSPKDLHTEYKIASNEAGVQLRRWGDPIYAQDFSASGEAQMPARKYPELALAVRNLYGAAIFEDPRFDALLENLDDAILGRWVAMGRYQEREPRNNRPGSKGARHLEFYTTLLTARDHLWRD